MWWNNFFLILKTINAIEILKVIEHAFLLNGFLWNALLEIPLYLSWEVVKWRVKTKKSTLKEWYDMVLKYGLLEIEQR